MQVTNRRRRAVQFAMLNMPPLLLAAACTLTPAVGVLAEGRTLKASCPSQPVATYVGIDASGSYDGDELPAEVERVLRDAAARTAVCGSGHLRVSLFAGSSAGTDLAFDENVGLVGNTDNARFRRIPGLQDHVVDQVQNHYRDRTELVGGSDILGQLRLAGEFRTQLGEGYDVTVIVVSDGLQTVGLDATKLGDRDTARSAAEQVAVPDLDSVDVTITGLGNAASVAASTRTTESLVAFYSELCANTRASRCTVVTDYVDAADR